MVDKKHIAAHQLEKILNNPTRGVEVSSILLIKRHNNFK